MFFDQHSRALTTQTKARLQARALMPIKIDMKIWRAAIGLLLEHFRPALRTAGKTAIKKTVRAIRRSTVDTGRSTNVMKLPSDRASACRSFSSINRPSTKPSSRNLDSHQRTGGNSVLTGRDTPFPASLRFGTE
jgi:hypothetical protein